MSQYLPTEQDPAVNIRKTGVFDAYVTFCALGGMMVSDTGDVSFMSQEEFCRQYDVDRHTLNRWKRDTPNFVDLQRQRRDDIVPVARESAALNRLFVIGMSSIGEKRQHNDQRAAVDALKIYAGHHSKLRLPAQSVEHEAGKSFIELVNQVRHRQVTEGEVTVERSDNHAGSGDGAGPVLPAQSS